MLIVFIKAQANFVDLRFRGRRSRTSQQNILYSALTLTLAQAPPGGTL